MSEPLCLMNCRNCEDIQRLIDKPRTCECGKSTGRMVHEQAKVEGPYARVFAMPFEHYDRLVTGDIAGFVVT